MDSGGEALVRGHVDSGASRRTRRRRPPSRARRVVVYSLIIIAALLAAAAAALALAYVPYVDRAHAARASAHQLAASIRALRLDVTQEDLERIGAQVDEVDGRLQSFRELLAFDPLVALARQIGPLREQIDGGAEAVAAADELIAAARTGLRVGQRFVETRARVGATTDGSTLASLVELMATSTADVDDINARLDRASAHLANVPANALEQVREAHDLMHVPLAEYVPLLKSYAEMDDVLPSVLGWGGQKRYLVLAQDPAELRPTGGFAGTYGLVTFEGGRLAQHEFHDIYLLDRKPGVPYQEPPPGLKNHLLGSEFSWELADSLWSPDLPTAARDAMRLYELESGGDKVDGLITLTTYALDDLLEVIGPVRIPVYGVTVRAGDVTLTSLALTRNSADPGVNRKQFLQELATAVLERLFALPNDQWTGLLERLQEIGEHRRAGIWLADDSALALVADTSWSGAVVQAPGDYLYVVDSNVAPTSKYNLVVTRSTDLRVDIDKYGNAVNTLNLTWQNDSMRDGEPYASLRSYSTGAGGIYGNYVRVLTPDRSRLQRVAGGSYAPITGPEEVSTISARTSFANYLAVPPGTASLSYSWISPYPVNANQGLGYESVAVYVLTIQKQPGMADEPISVSISVPDGARITAASTGLTVLGGTATFTGALTRDIQLAVRFMTGT